MIMTLKFERKASCRSQVVGTVLFARIIIPCFALY